MTKTTSFAMARTIAMEDLKAYGMSVLDGKCYVGSREELWRIGVAHVWIPCYDGKDQLIEKPEQAA